MTYDFSKSEENALTKPRDIAWSKEWGKFEKVGDKVEGFIVDVFYRPAQDLFKEQRGFTLKQENGELINVAIKRLPFILSKTDDLKLGDPLTIKLEELKKSDTKGFSATKIQGFYGANLPENAGNKTVAQLEKEDMVRGGSFDPDGEVVTDKNLEDDGSNNLPVIEA
jgi:hypothetical protein